MKWLVREVSLVTAVAPLVVILQPQWLAIVVHAWLVLVATLTAGASLQKIFSQVPVEWQLTKDRVGTRKPVEAFHMRDIDQANDFLMAVDYGLFPFLQRVVSDVAAQRLLAHHNVVLERDTQRARSLVGDVVWQVLESSRERGGITRWSVLNDAQLEELTNALEKV